MAMADAQLGHYMSRLDRMREAVDVAAIAAWHASQVVANEKVRALMYGTVHDDGIWRQMAAPTRHQGTPPRRIDDIADRAMSRVIKRYKPDAVITSEEHEGAWD